MKRFLGSERLNGQVSAAETPVRTVQPEPANEVRGGKCREIAFEGNPNAY